MVEFVSARAVLVADANGDSQADARLKTDTVPVLCTATEAGLGGDSPTTGSVTGSGLDDPALILFTSGTTGDPEGVVHSHRSILARLALNQAHIGAEVLARSLCVLPTHFGHGLIGNCLTPLLAGADLFLFHGGGVAASARLGELLDQHRITFISSVPAFWKVALRISQPPTAATLRRVHIGSAPLSAELWRAVLDWLLTLIALIGVLLPLLPTTSFLILALA